MGLKSRLREKRLAKEEEKWAKGLRKAMLNSTYGILVEKPKTPRKKKGG